MELVDNEISDEGVMALAQSLKHTKISYIEIDLGDNPITDTGAKVLAKAIKNSPARIVLAYYGWEIGSKEKAFLESSL